MMNTITHQESDDAWARLSLGERAKHLDCLRSVDRGYLDLVTLKYFSEFFPMEDKLLMHSNYFIKDTDCYLEVCYRLV